MPKNTRTSTAASSEARHATCRSCGHRIPKDAGVCTKCGTYQNRWKRGLQFAAAIVGVLSAVSVGVAYLANRLPAMRRAIAWRSDVKVIEFDSVDGLTVLNAGDGPVLLSYIALHVPGIAAATLHINQRVEPSQTATFNLSGKAGPGPNVGVLINHASPVEWKRAVTHASIDPGSSCVTAVVYARSDPTYIVFAESAKSDRHVMPKVEATAILHYVDLKTGAGQIDIPSHGLLFCRQRCAWCDPWNTVRAH